MGLTQAGLFPMDGEEKFSLPSWVPVLAWKEFEAMRKLIKAPMTDGARKRAIKKLEELSGRDHQIASRILERSVDNCWKGLFAEGQSEPKNNNNPVNALEQKRKKEETRKG